MNQFHTAFPIWSNFGGFDQSHGTMTKDKDEDPHPNLRQRKRPEAALGSQKAKGFEEEETKPLIYTTGTESSAKTSDADGYVLIPLRERSILTRLDVGPFLLGYGFLISLDFMNGQPMPESEAGTDGEVSMSSFSLFAFPLMLVLHIWLFLVQQWSVSWRAAVGYQRINTKATRSSSSSEKLLWWTHCLVEAPNVDKHQSSHDAGIIPVHHRVRKAAGNPKVLAVVNFHDIIFRCNIVDDHDADTSLWLSDKHSTPFSTASKSGLFHRLRYPINLPLSFYESWRGHGTMELIRKAQITCSSQRLSSVGSSRSNGFDPTRFIL